MVAYWINTFTAIHDEDKLQRYAALSGPIVIAAGGRILARGNPAAVYEQASRLRTVLVEFPDVVTATKTYESEAYQNALAVLSDGAEREIRIIDGV